MALMELKECLFKKKDKKKLKIKKIIKIFF